MSNGIRRATPQGSSDRVSDEPAPYAGSKFASLIADPVRGSFTLPDTARLSGYSELGGSGRAAVRLNGVTVESPPLNPGGRFLIGTVQRGTMVTPLPMFHIQVEVGFCEWRTIAL